MHCTEMPDGCSCLWHRGSSRNTGLPFIPWIVTGSLFHQLQPNDKSRLPGELAALTPALYFPILGLASCQDGHPGTSSGRRDCAWGWAHMRSGSCLGLAFQHVPQPDFFWFCLLNPSLLLFGILPRAFATPCHPRVISLTNWEAP